MEVNILFFLLFFGIGFVGGAALVSMWPFGEKKVPAGGKLHAPPPPPPPHPMPLELARALSEKEARKRRLMEAQIKFFD
jgi:hypothetical protein